MKENQIIAQYSALPKPPNDIASLKLIPITRTISLNPTELKFTFVRAPGPGGQNVNKVASAVQLRFNILRSACFTEATRERLLSLLASKLTSQGDLIIKASRFRTQERNKQDAIERLQNMLRRAATPPKKRQKTKPSRSSVQTRLSVKKRHSQNKSLRRSDLSQE